jgi:hypothetical protein
MSTSTPLAVGLHGVLAVGKPVTDLLPARNGWRSRLRNAAAQVCWVAGSRHACTASASVP